ncbi:MAG: MBOAT family protein, partial [Clostridia bacterium]|nr:MBOAT family protein [Clostridia bacterium]
MITEILLFLTGMLLYLDHGIIPLCEILLISIIVYGIGIYMARKRWLYWPGLAVCLAPLFLLKLNEVVPTGIMLPFGLSYFSLQLISYLTDVYKAKLKPERRPVRFLLYVTYYPHLFVGPIERLSTFNESLDRRRFSYDGISDGALRALWGAFKKLVIANRISLVVTAIAGETQTYSGAYALLAMLFYSIQLYADFSGGMDIVLGISGMLGIKMSENFDTPYLSETVQEFWRRWHMTLGSWLKDYVYIPLGGNRKGKIRKTFNLLVTFLVSGIWHGIHYILWGIINGIFVATGDLLKTKCRWLNRVVTFILISFLWAFFIWPDTLTAIRMMGSVFSIFNYGQLLNGITGCGLTIGDMIVLIIAVISLITYDLAKKRIDKGLREQGTVARWSTICLLGLMVLVFGLYG